MLKILSTIGALGLTLSLASQARGQALPTASSTASFQAGAGYTIATPDYGQKRIQGFTAFADYDVGLHFGLEFDAHIVNLITPTDIAENSYLAGPRFIYPFGHGRFKFYAKALAGESTFKVLETQDNQGQYNGTYFTYSLGGGLEYRLAEHIVVRVADGEYQRWPSYGRDGLTPLVYTFGVAYHFR